MGAVFYKRLLDEKWRQIKPNDKPYKDGACFKVGMKHIGERMMY